MKMLATVLAVCLLNVAVVTLLQETEDNVFGGISLAGCKTCADKSEKQWYCKQTTNPAGCSTASCVENEYVYAACAATPANETDNCPMHTDPMSPKFYQRQFQNTNGLSCTDNGLENFTPPQDGKCQSPGFIAGYQARCKLTKACGATVVPGTQTVTEYSRLVCG
ncbi:MAG: hypothetical protein JSS49_15870 [Planctomycetes bacterium]|nr:hypothetical protein [Planctomycetota bacterium]